MLDGKCCSFFNNRKLSRSQTSGHLCAAYGEEDVMNLKISTHMRTKWFALGTWQINFSLTWCEHTTNLSTQHVQFFLYLCQNRQILVHGNHYANCLQFAQHMFAFPCTHAHIWFANCLVPIFAPAFRNIQQWQLMFWEGRTNIHNTQHKGWPRTLGRVFTCNKLLQMNQINRMCMKMVSSNAPHKMCMKASNVFHSVSVNENWSKEMHILFVHSEYHFLICLKHSECSECMEVYFKLIETLVFMVFH